MRACLVLPVLAFLGSGCFNPDDASESNGETDDGSTSTASNTDGPSTASESGPTTATATTTTATATATTTGSTTAPPDTSSGTDSGSTTDVVETTETTDAESTGGPSAECGDGRVTGDEICDDGTNDGAEAGACRPDCAGVVEERIIRLSQNTVEGNFAEGAVSFVAAADAACPGGYQALIADGTERVGSLAALMGNGQVDWPIQPWTADVNADGATVWVTTELRLLGVADDNTWVGLNAAVAASGNAFTGMWNDYTTADLNCIGFTVNTGTGGDNRASFGNAVATDQSVIGSGEGLGGGCGFPRSLYCVEL